PPLSSATFLSSLPHPPRSTLFPYTTLFRSGERSRRSRAGRSGQGHVGRRARLRHCAAFQRRQARYVFSRVPVAHYRQRCHDPARSEEHTSELQSRGHLVCRLLLEKKKKKKK